MDIFKKVSNIHIFNWISNLNVILELKSPGKNHAHAHIQKK